MYIRSAACISPALGLEADPVPFLATLEKGGRPGGGSGQQQAADLPAIHNRFSAIEPDYTTYVDAKMIRRMSRIVKMGVASALRCLQDGGSPEPAAIITGTAYGCLEDTGIFLRRMIANKEEMLSPTAFIQSTHNTVGAQVALLLKCHSYNNTVVHRAFSLEHSLTEAGMLLAEGTSPVLVGAIDEITADSLKLLERFDLFRDKTPAGEGAAFFLLQPKPSGNDLARIEQVFTRKNMPADVFNMLEWIDDSLARAGIASRDIGMIVDGSNLVRPVESAGLLEMARHIAFKSFCGEFPTASGFGLWLGARLCQLDSSQAGSGKKVLLVNRSVDGHASIIILSPC